MTRTFYDVLEVSDGATQEEIEAAYRERVKDTHPDLNDSDDASERFQEVQRAEEVLGDPQERARYDRLGHDTYVRKTAVYGHGNVADSYTSGDPSRTAEGASTRTGGWGGVGEHGSETGSGSTGATPGGSGTDATGDTSATQGRTADASGATGGTAGTSATASEYEDATVGEGSPFDTEWAYEPEGDETAGTANDGGYAVHDWSPDEVQPARRDVAFNQETVLLAAVVFVLYPAFVYSSVTPQFSMLTNVIVGVCTLLVMGYLITKPRVGVVVFGTWSVLAPIAIAMILKWPALSPLTLLVLTVCWVPFGYSLVVAKVTGL